MSDSRVFLLVILLDLLLIVQEPPGVILQLTAGQLRLHDKGIRRDIHLTAEIHEFVKIGLRNDFLHCGFEMMDFSLFFHQLAIQFLNLLKQTFNIFVILLLRNVIVAESLWTDEL